MRLPYDTHQIEKHEPTALLEALLFLSGQPMKTADICAHTGWSRSETENTACTLEKLLADQRRGLALIRVAGGYQLVTRPDLCNAVSWVRASDTAELSPVGLEVLAIVAFKQPVTRADIEKLRGVSSERVLATLVQQGLVVELGRKDSPGRPILYGTSAYFLECIGMDSLSDLAGHVPVAVSEDIPSEAAEKIGADTEPTEDIEIHGTVTETDE